MDRRIGWTLGLAAAISAAALTACSHAPRNPRQEASYSGPSPIRQLPGDRQLANVEEDPNPLETMKKWVVTPDKNIGFVTNFDQVADLKLFEGEAAERPWSGSFWPDRLGGVAAQYRHIDAKVATVLGTERNYKKWKKRHARALRRMSDKEIALLSPAEKYDLLMGDENFTFSNKVWEGIRTQESLYGKIAGWSGICNGWTAASVEIDRPRRTIYATAPNGRRIPFYPDDIKALVSVLWAHDFVGTETRMDDGSPAMVMYGLRCNVRKPRRVKGVVNNLDEDNVAISKEECRDLNPVVWHYAMINRTGVQKQSFVMDKDYDAHVNNHTVYGYRFKYFNVQSGASTTNYRDAIVQANTISDPFKDLRSPRTKYLVGVEMDVKYVDYLKGKLLGETWDNESLDQVDVMNVKYDLELDENMNPVQGQWRVNRKQKKRLIFGFQKPEYPDFIWYQRQWTYGLNEQASDPYLEKHDWSQPIPEVLRERSRAGANVVWNYTLRERAELPVVAAGYFKDRAKKVSDSYDEACAKWCKAAYPRDERGIFFASDSKEYNAPEAVAARKEMKPFDDAFTEVAKKLDEANVPKSRPYVQPVARVVYGLVEAAKGADPNPPARPDAPEETEEADEE